MDIMTLAEAAKAMGASVTGEGTVTGVCIDSRSVTPECLFFAIKGDNFDGHDFVRTALNTGASAAVCSEPVEGVSKPVIMVGDTRVALRRLAEYNRSKYDIPVVGLTGSVGKTTTKDMVATVLRQKYNTLATEGNLNNEIGLPRMCLRLGSAHQAAVFEMGMSDFREISRLTRIAKPTVGLITNIGVSHIEKLGSREGILRAKLEILEGMQPDAPLILNGDDDMLLGAVETLRRPVLLYGIDNTAANCRAKDIVQSCGDISFTLCFEGSEFPVVLPVVGLHNVYNAMAAFLCGIMAGVDPQSAVEGLRGYVPDGRRQKIVHKGDFTFIEDCYNASPDSIKASLSVLASMGDGRRIAVLGDMLELGDYARKAHRECGAEAARQKVDILLAYGTNAIYYIEGAGEAVRSRLYDDKDAMADELFDMLEPGDTVLFKASRGMKLEDVIARLYAHIL